ncbi:MAG: ABC transporter ATP-binding protein [Erysipelotrichaceae bacterium]|nr:ABC transporter ATP-binding protein [Erysipelotrichaceae bacterium]
MILEMKNITKTYGNVVANNDVSISLNEGEILAIVGENGAGKTTLMKVLYGLEQPDSGEIFIRGEKVSFTSPSQAIAHGLGMVQQHFMLFGPMTVTENIVYNREMSKYGFFDRRKNEEKVRELSQEYGLSVNPKALISDCPVGTQQRVEILKTLYQNADIIIYDEPTAVLTPGEVDELLATMKNLAAKDKTQIIITHKLNEVMAVSDRVIVMRAGRKVGEVLTKDTSIDELSYMMIGRQSVSLRLDEKKSGNSLLKVQDLIMGSIEGRKVLDKVSLHVDEGEIVGIAGVSGNGQSELIRCITGLENGYEGKVEVCGKDVSRKPVSEVRKAGLSHIPEDRYLWGSAREASLKDNALMASEDSKEFSKFGVLRNKIIKDYTDRLISEYGIKVDSSNQRMGELSGGNAQKLITAREIENGSPLLIACEPTRGIDVGAAEFVHEKLLEKRNSGGGVLLVSSELTEILELSDRIYVMYGGKINYEFTHNGIDDRKLGLLMLGGKIDEER